MVAPYWYSVNQIKRKQQLSWKIPMGVNIYLGRENKSYQINGYNIVHFADGGILSLYGEIKWEWKSAKYF